MALELVIAQESHTADGTSMTIIDSTGGYDADNNEGGYGSPNPDRNSLALFILAFSKRYEGQDEIQDVELDVVANDPLTVSAWTVLMVKQGWVNIKVYGLKIYSTSLSFQINECVFDVTSQRIRKILTKTGTGPYTYTYVNIAQEDLLEASVNVPHQSLLDTWIMTDLCLCLQKARKQYFKTLDESDMQPVRKLLSYIDSATISFELGAPADAQLKIETAEKICSCLTENCGC
jgi:hypothetical protein